MSEFNSSLARARVKSGLSRPKLADAAGTTPQQIERLEKGQRKLTTEWAARLAPALGCSPQDLLFAREEVPLAGYASAGDDIMEYGSGQGTGEYVLAPAGAGPNTVAVEIRGGSLGALLDGFVAFYEDRRDPPDDSMSTKVCICGLPGDRVVIKLITRGSRPGLWHLQSQTRPTMFDQAVLWAAPVIAILPK